MSLTHTHTTKPYLEIYARVVQIQMRKARILRNRILHIWVLSLHFSPRHDAFLALQMVNFSSLHDEGRPVNALHQFHLIELVNALRMVLCIMVDFSVHRQLLLPMGASSRSNRS